MTVRALGLLGVASIAWAQTPPNTKLAADPVITILRTSCVPCHSATRAAGKLALDSVEALAGGGASGAVITPGDSNRSILYKRITATNASLRMPPAGAPLAAEEIALIRDWIEHGADGLAQRIVRLQGPVEFERDVHPILKTSCYPCHSGPQPRSELRLDAQATAMRGGVGGVVIVAGNSGGSRLVHRIEGKGGEPQMPLGRTPLTSEQIAILRTWIDQGATWPAVMGKAPADALLEKHWSYLKPSKPAVPVVEGSGSNPIDAFVLAALKQQGLGFSGPASKEKLIRRVSLDLIGLPPTPAEVAVFLADTRADAYEQLVDRLLASQRFGERWARPWLDYARYADTNGYEADFRRTMWKYREWVIHALNEDMPFDRFTIEQIAGDMLPNATVDEKIATGFHRNTLYNEEGGVDKDESYFEVLVDRVNTTSAVWLGSTLGCAQCHNHKYDPFTQKEYYQLMAFFSNAEKKVIANGGESSKYEEPSLDLPTPEQEQRRSVLKERIAALENRLDTDTPELRQEQREWERRVLGAAADWTTVAFDNVKATGGSVLERKPDGSIVASGDNPRIETYMLEGNISLPKITGLRIEALPDPTLPRGGPGRDAYGNFVLKEITLDFFHGKHWRAVRFDKKVADDQLGEEKEEKSKQLWIIDGSREDTRIPRQLVLVPDFPPKLKGSTRIRVSLRHASELIGQSIGRFRISVTSAKEPLWVVKTRAKLRSVMTARPEDRSVEDSKKLAKYYRSIAPSLTDSRDQLKNLKKELKDLHITTALVMGESGGTDTPADYVRTRGVFSAKADVVTANIPVALGSLPVGEPVNRLALARWLASRDNALTARVMVNRIWEQYFGRGIVETSEDFGSQGQRPSHPELLDWLAVEFMDRGWSMKAMHRLIVTSNAYRQSSDVTPRLLQIDPQNRLISRGPRMRLEAEMIRDVALSASGLLSEKIGGPSVFPPQPPGVWDLPYNDDQWEESMGPDKYRRGIYTFVRRSAPYPAMANFDAPSRETCVIRRTRTNTPLQALTTLNDAAFFEAAQALGRRLVAEGGANDRDRIDYGFRLCTSRSAAASEKDRLTKWRDHEREYFKQHMVEAQKVAPESADAADQAAWTMLANVLLNLDESMTKE